MKTFKGRTVWITGASSGIGKALVKLLANMGANLVISARNEQELKRVQQEAKLTDENSLVLPMDLAGSGSFRDLTNKVINKFGNIDILINNGGISQRSNAIDTSEEVERNIMEINFFGTVSLTKAVLPYMIKQNSGQLVVISSIAGKFGFYLRSTYSASKHALHGYYESLRMELSNKNIDVLLVCPEKVKTSMSINALKGDGSKHEKMDDSMARGISADECALQIIHGIKSGKEELYIGGFKGKFALWLKRFFPKLFSRLIKKQKAD